MKKSANFYISSGVKSVFCINSTKSVITLELYFTVVEVKFPKAFVRKSE